MVAPLFMQQIAEQNDTIVVAPNGRGYFDFGGSESDVYDAYDAAVKAFTILPGTAIWSVSPWGYASSRSTLALRRLVGADVGLRRYS